MTIKTTLGFLCVSALLSTTTFAQGTWSIMMSTGGSTTDDSAQYFLADSDFADVQHINETSTSSYSIMNLAITSSGQPYEVGAYDNVSPCDSGGNASYWTGGTTPYRSPGFWMRSYPGQSAVYKGLAFYGSFNKDSSLAGTGTNGADVIESVFLHEMPCYGGGREYGVTYDANNDNLVFYASTYTNCGATGTYCGGVAEAVNYYTVCTGSCSSYLNTGSTGYFYEIWPVTDGTAPGGCKMTFQILGPPPSYSTIFGPTSFDVGAIASADSAFCTTIVAEANSQVTITDDYGPTLSSLTSANVFNFWINTLGVYVGK